MLMQVNALPKRLPPWFKIRLVTNDRMENVRNLTRDNNLHTICSSAACPNQTECWNTGTAAFMILGNICTRNCRFCGVPKGSPQGLDLDEPNRVAQAVASLQLKYVVITSVTRDDLDDGGACLFASTIKAIRTKTASCRVEVLIPDFRGSENSLRTVLDASPAVLNHNIETVPALYPTVRPQADYQQSLALLAYAHASGALIKTGMMLGLGEGLDEVRTVMQDVRNAGCSILTLGQYLQPGKNHLPVEKYYHPDEFALLREEAMNMGFQHVMAGPLARSSYHAEQCGAGEGDYIHPF
jgi:lipoic acid synthetase